MASFVVGAATVAWTAGGESALLDGSEKSAVVNINAPDIDTTAFGAGLVSRSFIGGLYDWTIDVEAQFNPAMIGSAGNVTWSSGYAANVKSWNLSIDTDTPESTAFSPTVAARSYAIGLSSGTGSFEAFQDDSTVVVLPASAPTAARFIVSDSTNDWSLDPNIIATQVAVNNTVGEIATATYNFRTSGVIAADNATTTWAGQFFADGNVAAPVSGTFVLTSVAGQTFTGSAFRSNITFNCAVDGLVTVSLRFRGTGPLTIA
jgi:hypothetical protein